MLVMSFRVAVPIFSLFFISLLGVSTAFAQSTQASASGSLFNHQLIRRMVVFPVKSDPTLQASVEDAWWQAREELTRSRRFLVASKQFLIKSDVFLPRGELEPADSIILGKLLDAHGLVTLQLVERRLQMNVYDSSNGVLLWTKSVPLHPSLTVQDQLPALAKRVVADFVSSIPYQGFTIVDSLIGRALYEEGSAKLAQVDLVALLLAHPLREG